VPLDALKQLEDTLAADRFNVQRIDNAEHPILKLQKDNSEGVPWHVDISFNGHNEVHKSHEIDMLLGKYEGARGLALLVKTWMYSVGLRKYWPNPPCLTSHAWMLLVIEYMSMEAKRSEAGFFKWFLARYLPENPWTIGERRPPFEFEADNVAEKVCIKERQLICIQATKALKNITAGQLPWSTGSS
jgi:DNA polymerase sigma